MKGMRRFIALLLSIFLTFSCSACMNAQSSSSGGSIDEMKSYETKHKYDVSNGTVDLVANSLSDFVIIYPENQSDNSNIVNAYTELKNFFYQITNIFLPVCSDAVKTDDQKVLSIGKTKQFLQQDDLVEKLKDSEVGQQGYIVETKNTAVYMVAEYSIANVYAVYEWLEWQFNWHFYAHDEIQMDTGITNCKLKTMHIVDVPDFPVRIYGYGMARPNAWGQNTTNRYRVCDFRDAFNTTGISFAHNTLEYFPINEYKAEHSNWYSADGMQMCFSRDPDGIAEALFPKLVEKLLAQPEINVISFSAMDGGYICNCNKCNEDKKKYDRADVVYSAAAIKLLNKVAKKLKAWNEEVCPDREIWLATFSYGNERYAPVKLDENKNPILDKNGNYIPYSDEFILEDNIAVMYCFGGSSAYWSTGEHKTTQSEATQMKRWQALGATFITWIYGTYFGDHWLPINTIDRYPKIYEYSYNIGSIMSIENAENNANDSTDWGTLKAYLDSALRWDFQQDFETLVDDFMNAYYKEAAPVMKKFLADYRAYTSYLATVKGVAFQVNSHREEKTKENWPYQRIKRFLDYCQEAYKLIEPLKQTDPDRYQLIYDRIQKEECAYLYLQFDLYPDIFEYSFIQSYKRELYQIFIKHNLRKGEVVATESYFGF